MSTNWQTRIVPPITAQNINMVVIGVLLLEMVFGCRYIASYLDFLANRRVMIDAFMAGVKSTDCYEKRSGPE